MAKFHIVFSRWNLKWTKKLFFPLNDLTILNSYVLLPCCMQKWHTDEERPHGKEKYQSTDNTNIGKERGNSYWKNEEISRWNAYINTWTLNWYVLTITYVFLNQKRGNGKYTTMWQFWIMPPRGCETGRGETQTSKVRQ